MRKNVNLLMAALLVFSPLLNSADAAIITKADNTTDLFSGGSWVGGVAPTAADIGLWDSTVTTANTSTLGTNSVWGGVQITNPGGAVGIRLTASRTLTINGGVDASATTQDVTFVNGSGSNFLRFNSTNLSPNITVTSGRTVTVNVGLSNAGNTKNALFTGGGNVVLNGTSGAGGNMGFTINGGTTVTMNNATNAWGSGGGRNVTNGTLLVNGGLTGTTATTVNALGTLGGTGTIAGSVNVVGGTIAPGTSPGTLTITNALSLNDLSNLSYELNGLDTTIGGGVNDLITGVTNLTLDGVLNITETSVGSFLTAVNGSTWRLLNYSGTLTDNGLTLGTTPALASGGSLAIDTSVAGQVNLVYTAVAIPEPSSLGLIGLAFGAICFSRRRS